MSSACAVQGKEGPCCANKQGAQCDATAGEVGLKAHSGIRLRSHTATPATVRPHPLGPRLPSADMA